jgi:putative ABC transport system permease protein
MNVLNTLRVALRSLRRNVLRSLLTALGIIIGVAAVIALVSIGNGAKAQIEAQIASLGENLIIVFPGSSGREGVRSGWGGASTLTAEDAKAIAREIPKVVAVSPEVRSRRQVLASGRNWNTTVLGESPDFTSLRNWPLAHGAMFSDTDVERNAKVAVVGRTVVDQLFASTENPLEHTIRIVPESSPTPTAGGPTSGSDAAKSAGSSSGSSAGNSSNQVTLPTDTSVSEPAHLADAPFQIVGVLETKGFSLVGQDQDDVVIVPYTSHLRRVARRNTISSILVQVTDRDAFASVQQQITALLAERHRSRPDEPDFTVRTQLELLERSTATTKTMTLLLTGVAAVSLIVGGIGIMNIMLVSVTERTHEIGIRLAVGAHGHDVLRQFLIEAVILSLLGGLVGVAVGGISSHVVAHFNGWPADVSPLAVLIAVAFSAAVGIFFGYYPARRAARMDPIDALRFE